MRGQSSSDLADCWLVEQRGQVGPSYPAKLCHCHHSHISGIFFVLPCVETYQKVDLRTITLGVPPQEVGEPKPWLGRTLQTWDSV